jgi:Tol biopolymer transport system component
MVCASLGHDGSQGDSDSYIAYISADGSCVAFISRAGNLVTGIAGGQDLIYVRDLRAGTNSCVSLAPNGDPANAPCNASSISADGRFVGFDSRATNLVAGVANGYDNCFVRDRQSGTTALVSVASGGALGNADSDSPQLSADGRFVALESDASNLVSGDSNGQTDVFLRDLQTGQTTRISLSASGGQLDDFSWVGLSSISGDGSVIAFHSDASNVVPGLTNAIVGQVYLRDLGAHLGALAIAGNASLITVSWPAAVVATLQTNSSLASTNWTAYGGTVISLGGTNTVTLAPPTSRLFFRLH